MTNCRNDAGSFTASGSASLSRLGRLCRRCSAAPPRRRPLRSRRLQRVAVASAIAFCTFFSPCSASCFAFCTVLRLTIPRTGRRSEKIQPTPGTGLPPMSRPGSNSHSYSAWNSWNESFESTVPPVRSAIWSRKPSPRPTAPAGGDTTSPAASVFANAARSDGSMRCSKLASTTTVAIDAGVLAVERGHGFLQLGEARLGAALGREVGAVDHEVVGHSVSGDARVGLRPSRAAACSRPCRSGRVAACR